MNDNLLIAAVLREIADAVDSLSRDSATLPIILRRRAAELDPPEKNEKPA